MKRIISIYLICMLLIVAMPAVLTVSADVTDNLNFTATSAPFARPDNTVFPVYQESKAESVYGVQGMAILAYFSGAPGQIYAGRKTTAPADPSVVTSGTAFNPSTILRVSDPDGNLAAVYDFSNLENGEEAAIVNITEGKAGIWTIQLINARKDDTIALGIGETDYWGVRGEEFLKNSSTIPNPSYIYTQNTAEYIYVGTYRKAVQLSNISGTQIAASVYNKRTMTDYDIIYQNVQGDTVYRLDYPNGFPERLEIDGISGLLCPTPEAAAFLKGGWLNTEGTNITLENGTTVTDTTGVIVQGPLQARARAELIRIASEENLALSDTVDANGRYVFDRISLSAAMANLKNPQAEAQLFGKYGLLSSIGFIVERQITNISSKHLGRVQSDEEYAGGSLLDASINADFETGNYSNLSEHKYKAEVMATAATLPLDLNFMRGNNALITRSAMCLLYTLTTVTEDGLICQTKLQNQSSSVIAAMFDLDSYANAFVKIEPYLKASTKEILYQGFLMLGHNLGDYRGQGVTNQALFCIKTNLRLYKYTGDERYHTIFKRQIQSINDFTWSNIGFFNDAGYFMEGGLDAGYEYMNCQEYYTIYNEYSKMQTADEELLEVMEQVVEKSLGFECFFCAPQPNGTIYGVNHFSARTKSKFGTGNQPSYEQLFHKFPMASRRMQMEQMPANGLGKASTYPHVINSDEWAIRLIKKYYNDGIYAQSDASSSWADITYEAYQEGPAAVGDAEMPFEAEDDTVWERDGFIAFHHKGIYSYSFYGIPHHGAYTYLGGGPTAVWTEGTGNTLFSQKHLSSSVEPTKPEDIISTCIYGYDSDGNFIYSGKEGTDLAPEKISLKWTVPGKEFVISGTLPDGSRTVSWTYNLNEIGVSIRAKISPCDPGETFWLNIPILFEDSNLSILREENGVLELGYNDSHITYFWNEEKSHSLVSVGANNNLWYKTKCLRIPIGGDGAATVQITTESLDLYVSPLELQKASLVADGTLQTLNITATNFAYTPKNTIIICAFYNEAGQLLEVITCSEILPLCKPRTFTFGRVLDSSFSKGKLKLFLWNSESNLQPFTVALEQEILENSINLRE